MGNQIMIFGTERDILLILLWKMHKACLRERYIFHVNLVYPKTVRPTKDRQVRSRFFLESLKIAQYLHILKVKKNSTRENNKPNLSERLRL